MSDIVTTVFFLSVIAAITPGPLMALIISETLNHGKIAGIKIGIAPLFTDLPIMIIGIYTLSKIQHLDFVLGLISMFGAGYLAYLAYGNITLKEVHLDAQSGNASLLKGIVANFLNPNPYIFYFSILGPLVIKGSEKNAFIGPITVFIFLGIFVIINTILVLSVHSAKQFFNSKKYVYTIRILGLALLFFACNFFMEGLRFLGVFK